MNSVYTFGSVFEQNDAGQLKPWCYGYYGANFVSIIVEEIEGAMQHCLEAPSSRGDNKVATHGKQTGPVLSVVPNFHVAAGKELQNAPAFRVIDGSSV